MNPGAGRRAKRTSLRIGVIGGGAAGFFGAVNAAAKNPDFRITILEKSQKLLSKVSISGGGRCNVTNALNNVMEFSSNYPRGKKELISVFSRFSQEDTVRWFEEKGIKLKTEEDNRIFPLSDSSSDIVNCLLNEAQKYGVEIIKGFSVDKIEKTDNGFNVCSEEKMLGFDRILVSAGGSGSMKNYNWLLNTGHSVSEPVPSLFTFNSPADIIKGLEGISVRNTVISIKEHNLSAQGALLITHSGLSGPAVLKMSSSGARIFHGLNYNFNINTDWVPWLNEDAVMLRLKRSTASESSKLIASAGYFGIPQRLWERLCVLSGIKPELKWNGLSSVLARRFTQILKSTAVEISGKNTFKEEFVTCGGINLKEVDFRTMESKLHKGLYFAGEILDIDGFTGGFNFQSAWSTAWIFSQSVG